MPSTGVGIVLSSSMKSTFSMPCLILAHHMMLLHDAVQLTAKLRELLLFVSVCLLPCYARNRQPPFPAASCFLQCGILPYAGVDIALFEIFKDNLLEQYDGEPSHWSIISAGMMSSSIAQVVSYPLALVRTRLQVRGGEGEGLITYCLLISPPSHTTFLQQQLSIREYLDTFIHMVVHVQLYYHSQHLPGSAMSAKLAGDLLCA